MMRVLQIAWREFRSTAMTRAFIIGAFVIPGISVLAIPLIIRLTMAAEAPKVVGTVAIIDRSGEAAELVARGLTPEAIQARRGELPAQIQRQAAEGQQTPGTAPTNPGEALSPEALQRASETMSQVQRLSAKIPELTSIVLDPATADEEAQKQALWQAAGEGQSAAQRPLALVVIEPDAVRRGDGQQQFGTYALYHRPKMDDRILDEIRAGVRDAIREARYAAYDQDEAWLEALTTVRRPAVVEVTEAGERSSSAQLASMLVPFAFVLLLMMSVMIGSQYLLTTTIEEKSSRVVEVLLSAVSPMQLMSGKVLGQLLVGLTMLVIYGGLGMGVLVALAMTDLVSPLALVYLLVFFLLTYMMMGALTAAVGAAVNELREAQSLQGPIIMSVMIPYILWMPLSRDPNALWAQILSFIPPVSPFVMMIRVTSTDPPPVWEPLLAIGLNAAACWFFLWFAAKVFRVGLLMYGKPPNLATLIKWVRMA